MTRVEPTQITDADLEEWAVDAGSGCWIPPDVFLGILRYLVENYHWQELEERIYGIDRVYQGADQR